MAHGLGMVPLVGFKPTQGAVGQPQPGGLPQGPFEQHARVVPSARDAVGPAHFRQEAGILRTVGQGFIPGHGFLEA